MNHRAYSLLEIKQINDDQRIIVGTATTPAPDRVGDIVEPLGVKFKNPLPLLWQHRTDQPVGTVRFDKPTKNGITFQATMPKITEPGPLKDRVDTAWGEVKAGLVRAVSIGFRELEYSRLDDGGLRFIETEVLELSLVTIPANADATIQTIKSIDAETLAASGQNGSGNDQATSAGVTARKTTPVVKATEAKHTMAKKTIAEQISAFEATRQAKAARMTEIMDEAAEKGETLDAAQTEEYDGLGAELKSIDDHLVRLRDHEKNNVAAAVQVNGSDQTQASQTRSGVQVQVKGTNLPKGTAFTRYVVALARAKGSAMHAAEIAKTWHDSTPEVETVLKAAVAAGSTTDATWAAPLVEYQIMASEFIELLRPKTIIGRIPGFRRVPFKVKVPRQTGGSTVNWVGERSVKPVSALSFDSVTLDHTKIAGIVPLSEELARLSTPSAEAIIREDLTNSIAQFMDVEFVDPSNAAVTGVSPASVTNGVTAITATGTTAAALRADIKSLFNTFLTANLSVTGGVFIMTEQQALAISMMRTALDQPEFPGLTMTGGTFMGLPVVTSENIPAVGNSPTDGSRIIFVKANDILLADDGMVTIDASREASLQMDSAPDSPATASTIMVSLWQNNLIAIKAERYINWVKGRDEAVGYIDYAKYAE